MLTNPSYNLPGHKSREYSLLDNADPDNHISKTVSDTSIDLNGKIAGMRIAIIALGSRGDIVPYTVLGKRLLSAGHRVHFASFENYAPLISEYGLDFLPMRGDAQVLLSQAGADMRALVRVFSSLAVDYARDLTSHLPELMDSELIINQLPLGLYGSDLAEKLGIPMVLAAVMPLTRTRAFPVMGFRSLPAKGFNSLTYYLVEQSAWQMFRPTVNRWRQDTLGLPPAPFFGHFHLLGTTHIPILYGFSPQIISKPPDWGESAHITGYWFPEDNSWKPPDSLLRFIEAGPPPVFIGFGSMPIRQPERTTQIILEAIKRSGQRGILHMGWGNLGSQPTPENVYTIDYAPYGWLFPHMAMVVHHGGSGTIGFGLRAGVPNLVVPFVFDQFFWGARISKMGVGPKPVPFKKLSIERLANAIELATSDQQMREQASNLGEKIRDEDGTGNALRALRL